MEYPLTRNTSWFASLSFMFIFLVALTILIESSVLLWVVGAMGTEARWLVFAVILGNTITGFIGYIIKRIFG